MDTFQQIEQQIAIPGRDVPRIISEKPVDAPRSLFINISLAVVIVIVGIGIIFLLYPKPTKKVSSTPSSSQTAVAPQVPLTSQYNNPFNQSTQYTNPFQASQNPFSSLNQ